MRGVQKYITEMLIVIAAHWEIILAPLTYIDGQEINHYKTSGRLIIHRHFKSNEEERAMINGWSAPTHGDFEVPLAEVREIGIDIIIKRHHIRENT